MPRGVWIENFQINVGSPAKAKQGAQGKDFKRQMQGRRQEGMPGRGHGLCVGMATGEQGEAVECGAAQRGWDLGSWTRGRLGGWSRLGSN